ncbi:unnamed protein product [Ambrosiozyma monospora]|uniref:Unnamed protein product n=1 Tax=Ambrosiozyma monospora TaxID=43982 RepID=A0A9W6YXY7_AMBMO|nr:unnamed protein product [Ambrosiozyma monospora]
MVITTKIDSIKPIESALSDLTFVTSESPSSTGLPENEKNHSDLQIQEKLSCGTDSTNSNNSTSSNSHNTNVVEDSTAADSDPDSDSDLDVEDDAQILHGAKLAMCIFSTCLCLFLMALDQTITAAIISEVSAQFKSFDEITWITSGFFLGTGALCQIWGQVSTIWGRKWIMVLGIFIFELGSLICAVSQSMKMLIVGRVIQGMGGANIQTLNTMICAEVTTMELRPVVFSMIPIVYMIASVIGPIIGGLFTTYVSWRWCFYINLCFGVVIVPIFIFSFNPKTPKGTFKEKFKKSDSLGSFLMIGSIVLVLIAISFGVTDFSWKSGAVIACFILAGLLLIGFLIWNFKYSSYPLISRSIVKIPQLNFAVGSLSFGYAAYIIILQFISIYFQVIRDNDSINTGLSLLPIVISCALFSCLAGFVVKKTGCMKPLSIASGSLLCIGSGILLLLHVEESFSRRVGFLILTGVGCGLVFQPALVSAQMLAPDEKNGLIMTNAYVNFGQNISCALFSQLSQVIYTETLKSNLSHVAKSGKISEQSSSFDLVTLADNTGLLKTFPKVDQLIIKDAFIKSLHNTFYLSIGLSALALICACLMSNSRFPTKTGKSAMLQKK